MTDKVLRGNSSGATRSLSFRDLARLVVVTEEEIQRRTSPVVSGQFVQATPECAAFKLLLTGTDDSSLVAAHVVAQVQESVSGKIDLLEEMIEDLQIEIDEAGLDEVELQDQHAKLEASIVDQNNLLNEAQDTFDSVLENRGEIADEIKSRRTRLIEIEELVTRFSLLDQHYSTDLKQLETIHESGSLFVHMERRVCPLCGAEPGAQHVDQECDGNVESIIEAAGAELGKIQRLQRELTDTVVSLNAEYKNINAELSEFSEKYSELDAQLSEIARPEVSNQGISYNQLIAERAEANFALDKFQRLKRLVQQRDDLDSEESSGANLLKLAPLFQR